MSQDKTATGTPQRYRELDDIQSKTEKQKFQKMFSRRQVLQKEKYQTMMLIISAP
jgi:hypothetical protein